MALINLKRSSRFLAHLILTGIIVTLLACPSGTTTKGNPILADKKSNEEMLGEVLRDIGVLIAVFFPFDEWITFHELTWKFALGSVSQVQPLS